jgi:hypothetical protein
MKKVLFTLAIFCFLTGALIAQNVADLEAFEVAIKPTTTLTYDINDAGKKFQLIITLKKLGDEIVFDWKTTEKTPKAGTVYIGNNAVMKADALFSSFVAPESKLDKETAIFISRKTFNDVSATSAANIKIGGAADTATAMSNTIGEFNFSLNGNLVAIPGWELEGGTEIKYVLDVIESTRFPIIYKLDMGWSMQLVEIKSM